MPRQIIIAEQHRIAAVFSEEQIQELVVASGDHQVGDVYSGVVENVLPSIDAAFVNIGNSERNGFIHVSDLGPIRLKRGSVPITELVVPQQKVLVQVMKEPTGNKGPRLTGEVSLPGRYLVLWPYGRGVKLSKRLKDPEERNRLKSLAILIKPVQMGLVLRTEAQGVADEAISEDLKELVKKWEGILQEQEKAKEAKLLNRDHDFIQRVLRDTYSTDVNRIVTDSPEGAKRVRQFLQSWNQNQMPPGVVVDAHRDPQAILEYYRVNAAIRQALRPRVDLPSGGYIIIEPTEALTVIDVNSGSFTQSATSRETVLWTNCEAATEISRQLRLRNIAGVIVVDFIDMDSRQDQQQVIEHFNKAINQDKATPQIAQLSELGLVELTRKRQGQSLYELFGRKCPTCDGLGLLAYLPGGEHDQGTSIMDPNRSAPLMLKDIPAPGDGASSTGSGGRERNGGSRTSIRPRGGRSGGPSPYRRGDRASEPESGSEETPLETGSPKPILSSGASAGASSGDTEESSSRERERVRPRSEGRGKSGWGEGRSRSSEDSGEERSTEIERESGRFREGPRRLIQVEMTPLQQRVYSEMGLSPLLLKGQVGSAGRDTQVSVCLPGQLQADPTPSAEAEPPATPEPFPAPRSPEPEPQTPDLEIKAPDPQEPTEEAPLITHSTAADPSESSAVDPEEPTPGIPLDPSPTMEQGSLFGPPPEPILVPEQQSPPASRRRRSSQPREDG